MRLFAGLSIPPDIATGVLELGRRAALPDLRWTTPENLHLTLYFLGECPESLLPPPRTALDHLHPVPVEITVTGLDIFPRAGVLVAAVERTPALLRLQSLVAGALAAFGARPDPNSPPLREYHPHITVARAPGLLRQNAEELPRPDPVLHFTAERVHLYRSVLGPASHYEVIHSTAPSHSVPSQDRPPARDF